MGALPIIHFRVNFHSKSSICGISPLEPQKETTLSYSLSREQPRSRDSERLSPAQTLGSSYPRKLTKLWNMAIEIVSFPIP